MQLEFGATAGLQNCNPAAALQPSRRLNCAGLGQVASEAGGDAAATDLLGYGSVGVHAAARGGVASIVLSCICSCGSSVLSFTLLCSSVLCVFCWFAACLLSSVPLCGFHSVHLSSIIPQSILCGSSCTASLYAVQNLQSIILQPTPCDAVLCLFILPSRYSEAHHFAVDSLWFIIGLCTPFCPSVS